MIFFIFIIELALFALFRSHDETAKEMLGVVFVITNSVLVLAYLASRVKSVYLKFFVIGIALRLFLLFANCYDWFYVPHTGADSEVFAARASTNYEQGNYDIFYTNYTYFLTTLYLVLGSDIRMIAQYLNLVFGMGVMLVGLGIFEEIGLDEKRKSLGMFLLAAFPMLCVFSAILMREAPMQYFLALSTLCFIRWMKNKGPQYFYLSFLCILCAAWFHAGCIFWTTGYLAAMLYYRPAFGKNTFTPATIAGAVVAGVLAIIACTFFMDGRVEAMAEGLREGDTVVRGEAAEYAGSAYLTWLDINSPYLLLLFSPLKMFYFIYSPIPFDWRGAMDVVAFFGDSTFYIWASWVILRNYRKRQGLPKNISLYLGVSLLFMTFAFAFGTIASGTAIRHRCKFMPELLTVALLLSAPVAGTVAGGPPRRSLPPPPPPFEQP